ncbi:glycosyltransferase [Methylotenera sp.]|uniref:glycosyltransferase n=1 Tax=Methylotenera sp. TaxID=2051956 RepID=UPI002731E381|nr:glycosyltransferase [Methylotenera sp.]MDP2071935.1 glycosyltransferase [Methylotenera sp.]MDP3005560.1 glycosyltransferase [Methylotenera sp.]
MNEENCLGVAVLLSVYNGMEWIREQIDSILNQEGVEVTVFISIDPSSDGSEELCSQFASQYKNIFVLPNVGKFGGAAKNFFRLIRDVDFSNYDYIALADQDDIWQQDKLSKAIEALVRTKVDAYSSNVIAFWPDGKQKLISKAQPQRQWDYMFESAGPGCTFVLTKKLALEAQTFLIKNEKKCQNIALHDWFIYAFARSRGFKWFIDREAHMLYRQHASNVVGANVGLKAKLARWQKLREGWLVKQVLLIADVLGYHDAWPIQKLKQYHFFDRLTLIKNIHKLRRRLRDRVALALFLLLPLKK